MGVLRNPEVRYPLLAMLAGAVLSLGAIALFLNKNENVILLLCAVGGAFALCCVIFLTGSVIHSKKVRSFTVKVERNLRGKRELQFDTFREGDFNGLQNVVQKMAIAHALQEDRLKEEKGRLKDALENITHQLKTPLTPLTLSAERLLEDEVSTADRKRAARTILGNAEHIDSLVQTLLKLARLDAGVQTFRDDVFSVEDLLDEVCEPLEISMDLGDITLKRTVTPGLTMTSDFLFLKEALMNVVKNCMEHTPPGGTIYIDAASDGVGTQFVIRDTGSGIAEEDLPHIFERFHSGKDAGPKSVGIGLSFTSQVIHCLGGTVRVRNHPEGGAEFTLRIDRINV